jgi:hypothetical protein
MKFGSFVMGNYLKCEYNNQVVLGAYNVNDSTNLLEVGVGTSGGRATAFAIKKNTGEVHINYPLKAFAANGNTIQGNLTIRSDMYGSTEITSASLLVAGKSVVPTSTKKTGFRYLSASTNDIGIYHQGYEIQIPKKSGTLAVLGSDGSMNADTLIVGKAAGKPLPAWQENPLVDIGVLNETTNIVDPVFQVYSNNGVVVGNVADSQFTIIQKDCISLSGIRLYATASTAGVGMGGFYLPDEVSPRPSALLCDNDYEEWQFTLDDGTTISKKVAVIK